MGLFKNIISKIASVFSGKAGEIKSPKVLKMANLKKSASVKEAGEFEVAAVKHFDKSATGKTLQEVVDYVKNLGNFVDVSEFQDRMDVLNYQRKQASNDATKLTADGLFKYFAGGQNLSEQDKKAYALIAKQTQAKARALAYIKANFVGICNMRDIYGSEGEKAFAELMKVVQEYADPDINGYTLPEFNPEIVNDETYNNADIYIKGASYAQKRCDALLAERVDAEVERANETAEAGKNATAIIKEYDASIIEVAANNAAIKDIDEKLGQAAIISEKLAALKEEYDENEDEHAILRNWVKGKDIVKPAAERRDEFMDAFRAIARDFPVAYYDDTVKDGKTKGFSFIFDRNTLGQDLASAENGNFQVVFDKNLSDYDALVDAIAAYNNDDTADHSNDIFKTKIEVGSDGKRKSYLYTTRQEKVMKDIFDIMKAHAQAIVNDSEYNVGDNLLKDFKYKNVRHSPNPGDLKMVAEIIFGSNVEKGANLDTAFENLSVDQLETLFNFIRTNEAVKAFIESNKDIRDFEIDSRLLDALNPEVADKKDLKLSAVMNAMQREAIDSTISRVEEQTVSLQDDKDEHVTARDDNYQKASEGLEKLDEIKRQLERERLTAGDSVVAKDTDGVREQLAKRIGTILSKIKLPEDKEAVDAKAKKIGNLKIRRTKKQNGQKVTSTISYVDEMARITDEAESVAGARLGEQSNIAKPGNSIETRADYYRQYFTQEDSEKVGKYMADIESVIDRIKAAQNAPVEEYEAE